MRHAIAIALSVVFLGAPAFADKDPTVELRWNLARDIGRTGNQISFRQGARGVWYFMESHSLTRGVHLYRFIPDYNSPALPASDITIPEGFACWQNPEHVLPDVCFNFNTSPVTLENFEVPPRSVDVHPGVDQLTIVAWRSPVRGRIRLSGAFRDLDANCGDGIRWFIDRGNAAQASGEVANGSAQSFELALKVRTGEVLYFIVDPAGDHVCDSTGIDLTIVATVRT